MFFITIALLRLGVFQCFFNERAAASEEISMNDCFWKKNMQLLFFVCVAASGNISLFFNERAAASEKISMNDCLWKKMCICF